ncbi:hypothetical protein BC938DRAFT_481975 [Jimgerdemannia flammicorona]|uniref:Uncharacterized protein n=1 Tax=Jimgerdemannia flammicorona TaxID=994334 RepID=A0A433QWW4_9FUNG|nr:hypothetical protein BC938DRAFT_481975 [Jimgerdemannia flammicorona]
MLNDHKYVPESRLNFANVLQNVRAGQSITLPNLGDRPKHFGQGYQEGTFIVTQQMVDIWQLLSADQQQSSIQPHSIKRVLSGPMGVGKSYLALFLAAKAYSEYWPMLYIADATKIDQPTEEISSIAICKRFLSINKDILTAAELKQLVQHEDKSKPLVVSIAATIFCDLLQQISRKTLLVVDEHGVLFISDPPTPQRLPVLIPLMSLTYWAESAAGARVVLTGTAHAKFEKKYLRDGMQDWIEFAGPLTDDIFDKLLGLHTFLGSTTIIKEEVKKVTNCVPRELIQLDAFINSDLAFTNVNSFKDIVSEFENERIEKFQGIAQNYFINLPDIEKNRYRSALGRMFLPSGTRVAFEWKFLDLGLVYRFKDPLKHTHYLPLCPSAQKALLNMYLTFDLPQIVINQLRIGKLSGEQFEDALFNRLLSRSNTETLFTATDLNNQATNPVRIEFKDYRMIKPHCLSLGPGYDKVLGRGFDRYPRFDFMLGPMFIQVSISDFATHNAKESTDIKNAFARPMRRLPGMTIQQIAGRNQIEMYLDEI